MTFSLSLDFSFPVDDALDPSWSVLLVEVSWLLAGLDSFFHFILLFWNQVFTWVSFKPSVCASLARFDVSKYFCSANVFSKTRSWRSVKTVRDFRHLRPLGVLRVGLTRKYTGSWLKTSGLGSAKERRIYTSRATRGEDSLRLIAITKGLRRVDIGLKSSQDFKGCFVTTKASNQWWVNWSPWKLCSIYIFLAELFPCLSSRGTMSLSSCIYKRKWQRTNLLFKWIESRSCFYVIKQKQQAKFVL